MGGPWQVFDFPVAMTDYAGNGGLSTADGNDAYEGWGQDGMVCANELGGITFEMILDGSSNTMMVGEKRMNLTYATTECQPDDNAGYTTAIQDDIVRWGDNPPAPDFRGPIYTFSNLYPSTFQFGSSHPGGFQSVFADGAVHMIHFNVKITVYQAAASRSDGYPLNLDDL